MISRTLLLGLIVCVPAASVTRASLVLSYTTSRLSDDLAVYDVFVRNTSAQAETGLKLASVEGVTLSSANRFRFAVGDLTDATLAGAPDGIPDALDPFNDANVDDTSSLRASPVARQNAYEGRPRQLVAQPSPWAGGRRSFSLDALRQVGVTPATYPDGFRIARLFVSGPPIPDEPIPFPGGRPFVALRADVIDESSNVTTLAVGPEPTTVRPPPGRITGIPESITLDPASGPTSFTFNGLAVSDDPDATVIAERGPNVPSFMTITRPNTAPATITVATNRSLTAADAGVYQIQLNTSSYYELFAGFFPVDSSRTLTITVLPESTLAVVSFLIGIGSARRRMRCRRLQPFVL